jgi:hypothetical protein
MENKTGKFSFVVPADSPIEADRGQKQEREYTFTEVSNEKEAQEVITQKEWSLINLVNDKLKSSARANAYQSALSPHKPKTVSDEDIVERMVRDFIRLRVPESTAREMVAAATAK